jgi:hypothetical protein
MIYLNSVSVSVIIMCVNRYTALHITYLRIQWKIMFLMHLFRADDQSAGCKLIHSLDEEGRGEGVRESHVFYRGLGRSGTIR